MKIPGRSQSSFWVLCRTQRNVGKKMRHELVATLVENQDLSLPKIQLIQFLCLPLSIKQVSIIWWKEKGIVWLRFVAHKQKKKQEFPLWMDMFLGKKKELWNYTVLNLKNNFSSAAVQTSQNNKSVLVNSYILMSILIDGIYFVIYIRSRIHQNRKKKWNYNSSCSVFTRKVS